MDLLHSIQNEKVAVLHRIATYVKRCKAGFGRSSSTSNSAAKFFKIRNVFMLENGIVDEEAIETLSKLCKKKGICELLEFECKITFQLCGKFKKIGIKTDSCINSSLIEKLVSWLLMIPSLSDVSTDVLPATIMETDRERLFTPPKHSGPPKLCSRRPSRMGKNVIKRSIMSTITEKLGCKRSTEDIDILLQDMMSPRLHSFRSSILLSQQFYYHVQKVYA